MNPTDSTQAFAFGIIQGTAIFFFLLSLWRIGSAIQAVATSLMAIAVVEHAAVNEQLDQAKSDLLTKRLDEVIESNKY